MEIAALIVSVIIAIVIAVKTHPKDDKIYGKPSALPMNTAIYMRNTSSWKRAAKKHDRKMREKHWYV